MSNPIFKFLHTSYSRTSNIGFGLANLKGKLRGGFSSKNKKAYGLFLEAQRNNKQSQKRQPPLIPNTGIYPEAFSILRD